MKYSLLRSMLGLLALVAPPVAGNPPKSAVPFTSFAGMNHYYLSHLPGPERDKQAQAMIDAGARVIRTIVRPMEAGQQKSDIVEGNPDVESPIGVFHLETLDHYDDTLRLIHDYSKGRTKVVFALHDANFIARYNDLLCDAYCQALADKHKVANYKSSDTDVWQEFYTDPDLRAAYKERFKQILSVYKSKNFGGRTWNTLSGVILGIDLQNEPYVSLPNIPAPDWICDIATHIRDACQLSPGIAIMTGGIRGDDGPGGLPPSKTGVNWPDAVFDCPAINVIALHGYYTHNGADLSNKHWYDLLIQGSKIEPWGGVLRQRALDKGKLLMVQEWTFQGGNRCEADKRGEIWEQGHALNVRRVPWIYWDAMGAGDDNRCPESGWFSRQEVSVYGGAGSAFEMLAEMMREAQSSATEFNWSRYMPGLENNDGRIVW